MQQILRPPELFNNGKKLSKGFAAYVKTTLNWKDFFLNCK